MPGPTEPTVENTAGADMRPVAASLRRLRATARLQLVFQRAGVLLAAVFAVVIVVGVLDYFLRLPMPLRFGLWLAGAGFVIEAARRRLVPALCFNPDLTQMALRLEASPAGRRAGISGRLASGLELSSTTPATDTTRTLVGQSVADAARRFGALGRSAGFLRPARLNRALAMLAVVGAPILALSLTRPELARIGTARILTPWSAAAWPKRSEVVNASQPIAHAVGVALPLRALVTRSSRPDGQTDVTVTYRVLEDGRPGQARRALLTSQHKRGSYEAPGGAPPVEGELYERLLDTASLVPPGSPARQIILEFTFATPDDATQPWRVLLVEPPAVIAASLDVEPPAYALPVFGPGSDFIRGTQDLGPGRDDRASAGPILAGSRVTLRLQLNKPLPTPADAGLARWAERVMPGLETASDLEAAFEAAAWTISFRADRPVRIPVNLVDAFGIVPREDAAYRLEVVPDAPPTAAVVEPPHDEAVLATAVIDAAGEGRDDVALAGVTLTLQAARPPAGSIGAAPEATGDPAEVAAAALTAATRTELTTARAVTTLDLSTLDLKPGDEVWLIARAQDLLAAAAPVVSPRRRLRIIAESEFVEQVRAELSGLRESAVRAEKDQQALLARTGSATDPLEAARESEAQQDLGERMTPMGDTLDRLSERVERNRLSDASLAALLADAQEFVDAAGKASDEAAAALEQAASPARTPAQHTEDAAEAGKAQAQVQAELTGLANLLDRGQDSWAVRRALEKLLAEQKQIRAQTQAAAQSTQGQAAESLPQAQKDDLGRLSKAQQAASQRAAALAETLRQRAEQMKDVDPLQAEALAAAAQKTRSSQLPDLQQQAAQQISKNQTGQADELQAQAERAIQDVLDELDKAEQKRNDALRRVLADLVQSLERLIAAQQAELDRLGPAIAANNPAELDVGMIALQQNTLGVLETAAKGVRDGEKLREFIQAAAAAQGLAVASIRTPDLGKADEHEKASLERLTEALAEARRLEEQAEEQDLERQRVELKKAYAEALELQVAVASETKPLVGRNLDRRLRLTARELGDRQGAIRGRLAELRSGTQELAEARLFEFAHTRLDESTTRAAQLLGIGQAPRSLGRDQAAAVRTLQGLVLALTDNKKKDDFREDEQGDGGGGGGSGGQDPLIPPLAQLKLLRAMQQEAADLTRDFDDIPVDDRGGELEGVMKLQSDLAGLAQELLDQMNEAPDIEEPQ